MTAHPDMPSVMQSQMTNASSYSFNTRKALGKNGDKSARLNNRKILEDAQKRKKEVRGDSKVGGFFLERSRSHNNVGEQMEPPGHHHLDASQDQNLININTNTSGSMVVMAPPSSNTQLYHRDRVFGPHEMHTHASNQQNQGGNASIVHHDNSQYNVYNSIRNVSASSSNRLL